MQENINSQFQTSSHFYGVLAAVLLFQLFKKNNLTRRLVLIGRLIN